MAEKMKVYVRIRPAPNEEESHHGNQRHSLSPKPSMSPVRSRANLEKVPSKQLLSSQSASSKSLIKTSLSASSSQSKIPRLITASSMRSMHSATSLSNLTRPLSHASNCVIKIDDEVVKILKPEGHTRITDKLFLFDKIFQEEATTQELYSSVSSSIMSSLSGLNSTIVSMGPANTGKTHTMFGDKSSSGIIPKALFELFREVELIRNTNFDVYYYLEISFVELYNNKFINLIKDGVTDLVDDETVVNIDDLNNLSDFGSAALAAATTTTTSSKSSLSSPSSKINQLSPTAQAASSSASRFAPLPQPEKIEIRESKDMGVFLCGSYLRTHVSSAEDAVRIFVRAARNRSTRMINHYPSSRGHAIFTIYIEKRVYPTDERLAEKIRTRDDTEPELKVSRVHLVDLAGSGIERLVNANSQSSSAAAASMSSTAKKEIATVMIETQNINASLSALNDVLVALTKRAAGPVSVLGSATTGTAASSSSRVDRTSSTRLSAGGTMHVPFLNSKLTHFLKDSFDGNCRTVFIAHVSNSPEYHHVNVQVLVMAEQIMKLRESQMQQLVSKSSSSEKSSWDDDKDPEIARLKKIMELRSREIEQIRLVRGSDPVGKGFCPHCTGIEAENVSLKATVGKQTSLIEELTINLRSSKDILEISRKQALEKFDNLSSVYGVDISKHKMQVQALTEKNAENQYQIEDLSNGLVVLHNEKQELTAALHDMELQRQHDAVVAAETIAQLRRDADANEAALHASQLFAQHLQTEVAESQQKILEFAEHSSFLLNQVQEQEQEIQELMVSKQKSLFHYAEKEKEIQRMEEAVAELQSALQEEQEHARGHEAAAQRHSARLDEATDRLCTLDAELAAALDAGRDAAEQLASLTDAQAAATLKDAKQTKVISILQDLRVELESQLSFLQDKTAKDRLGINQLGMSLADVSAQLWVTQDNAVHTQQRVVALEEELQQERYSSMSLATMSQTTSRLNMSLERQVEQLTAERDRLQGEVDDLEALGSYVAPTTPLTMQQQQQQSTQKKASGVNTTAPKSSTLASSCNDTSGTMPPTPLTPPRSPRNAAMTRGRSLSSASASTIGSQSQPAPPQSTTLPLRRPFSSSSSSRDASPSADRHVAAAAAAAAAVVAARRATSAERAGADGASGGAASAASSSLQRGNDNNGVAAAAVGLVGARQKSRRMSHSGVVSMVSPSSPRRGASPTRSAAGTGTAAVSTPSSRQATVASAARSGLTGSSSATPLSATIPHSSSINRTKTVK